MKRTREKKDSEKEEKDSEKTELKPKVSVLANFLIDFIKLPRETQGKVANFFRDFARNPRSHGIKYEPLGQAGDDRVRAVRFDDAYRGILYTPEEGNIHLLLRVDIEEVLYKWVKQVKFKTLKRSDEVVVSLVEKEESSPDPSAVHKEGLLVDYSDADLKSVGVPADLVPVLKTITDANDLGLLVAHMSEKSLSKESREAVKLLASRIFTIEEVRTFYLDVASTQMASEAAERLIELIIADRMAGTPWKDKVKRSFLKAKEDNSPDPGICKVVKCYLEDVGS